MSDLLRARALLWGEGDPPLSFEAWGALAPRLAGRGGDERHELLAKAGVEPSDWEQADGYWGMTLAAECARGDRARAEAHGRACAADLVARPQAEGNDAQDGAETRQVPAEDAAPAQGPRFADLTSSLGVVPEPPAVVPRIEVTVPTFLQADRRVEVPPIPVVRQQRATLEIPPSVVAAACSVVPFTPRAAGMPAQVPARPIGQSPQSGATLDLSSGPRLGAPLLDERHGVFGAPLAASTPPGRDPTATVALDPEQVAQMLRHKPRTGR